jgi:hypothetical protein
MKTRERGKWHPEPVALILTLGLGLLQGSWSMGDDGPAPSGQPKDQKWGKLFHKRKVTSQGTLGYGPPGLHPGFQGFGLGYHPG